MSNEVELHERITLEGAEEAEGRLHRLAGAVGRVAGAFEGLTEMAGILGGIGAAWKLAEGFEEATKLYGAVGRIASVTGMAAAQAHGMFDAFEKAGVEMESAESVMTSMARMAGRIGGSISVSAEDAAKMNQHMLALGVNIKNGPREQMLQMSEAAVKGRLGMQDLVAVFGVQRGQAEKMLVLLKQGPEKLKDTFAEVERAAGVIDDKALESFQEMQKARRELLSAWSGIVLVLYKSLAPAVTAVLETIKGLFDDIAPVAKMIGETLSAHMSTVVALTKTWLGLMAANKVLNMFGEKKIPLIGEGEERGRIARIFGGLMNFVTPSSKSQAAAAIAGELPGGGGIGGLLIRILSSVAGKFTAIGVIVAAVGGAFALLRNNTAGLRTLLAGAFSSVVTHLKDLFERVSLVAESLWKALKPVVAILGGALIVALTAIVTVIDGVVWAITKIIDVMIDMVNWLIRQMNKLGIVSFLTNGLMGGDLPQIKTLSERAKEAAEKTKTETAGEKPTVYQDFRGSKFEIMQNFDKGVDGGRVSVATADSLARLGERRIDSGLRPIYSYR